MTTPSDWTSRSAGGRPLVLGNWKMVGDRRMLPVLTAIAQRAAVHPDVAVGIAVPHTLISSAVDTAPGLTIGAQDIDANASGAFTGAVSAAMIRCAGGRFTLLGHSERRQFYGENSSTLRSKMMRAAENGLTRILCCGEALCVRDRGDAEGFVRHQLLDAIPSEGDWRNLVIAYEPCWAIGTGRLPTSDQVRAMTASLRMAMIERFGTAGMSVPIIYGGSLNGDNTRRLLAGTGIDGCLIGSASTDATAFSAIVRSLADR